MAKQPNILILMVDQLNGTLFPNGPADFLHTPNLKKLSESSTRFTRNYTASPLCAPGRASFMAGQLPSRTGVYDNAAEFTSSIPTFAHHLRTAGYYTCLSGKMHFVGADQLHGFEERLTTDVYPPDFGWTPDYRKPGERIEWWYHNLGSVDGAGIAEISNQLEYDDEVAHFAKEKIYQLSRRKDDRPWALTVSFTHPHDPYVARKKYWNLYNAIPQLEPTITDLGYEAHDQHSKRLYDANDYTKFDLTPENIRRARQGYFANISYIDDKIGEILEALEGGRMAEDTIVVFCSDHGDMIGEKGLWFKMSFFEGSARTPLMISAPQMPVGTISEPTSNLDIYPTLCDLVGIDISAILPWTDGHSLVPVGNGEKRHGQVPIEYAAEGSIAPLVCLIDGEWKFTFCTADPNQLFNLKDDPNELNNLAEDPAEVERVQAFLKQIETRWDMAKFDADIRSSQAQRWVVYEALRNGNYYPWDFQPLQKASERYMRNHMDLNILEEENRFPRGE